MAELFRKKPVTVRAWRVPDRGEEPSLELIDLVQEQGWAGDDDGILIDTPEGQMLARAGDYIIEGVEGEYYPCKASVLAATYERVGSEPQGEPTQ